MATSFPGLSPNRQRESRNEVARMEVIKKKIEIGEEKFRNEKKQKFLK